MKKCTYCGKEYPDEVFVCTIDHAPLQAVFPPTPPFLSPLDERQQIIDGEHIKLLSIFHFVIAGLAILGIAFLGLHYFLMSSLFSNPDLFKNQPHSQPLPKDFFKIFVWFYFFMGFIFTCACVCNFLSGLFLHQRKHRTFSLVVGCLNCLQIPFGTALGVFTIIVLARSSVRSEYANKASTIV